MTIKKFKPAIALLALVIVGTSISIFVLLVIGDKNLVNLQQASLSIDIPQKIHSDQEKPQHISQLNREQQTTIDPITKYEGYDDEEITHEGVENIKKDATKEEQIQQTAEAIDEQFMLNIENLEQQYQNNELSDIEASLEASKIIYSYLKARLPTIEGDFSVEEREFTEEIMQQMENLQADNP